MSSTRGTRYAYTVTTFGGDGVGLGGARVLGACVCAHTTFNVWGGWLWGVCLTVCGAVRQRPIRTQPTQRKRVAGTTVGRHGRMDV